MLEHPEAWNLMWTACIFIIVLFGAVSGCLTQAYPNEPSVIMIAFILTLMTGVGLYLYYEAEKERRRIEMEKQLLNDFGYLLSGFTKWLLNT